MKICPRCQKTYNDDNLNFCLDDGAVLSASNQTADNSIPPTILMNQTRPTAEPAQFGSPSASQPTWNAASPQQPQGQFSMQPPAKKSKAWLWVVGILGLVMLLCGGGFIGLIAIGLNADNSNNKNRPIIANTSNRKPTLGNRNSSAPNTDWNSISSPPTQTVDMSKWVKGATDLGDTDFTDGELLMNSKKKNYYYVITAPAIYKTEEAVTKLTVRNVNADATKLGYGLVLNSNPIPLTQDYAFLIDSENKKYRVVRHTPGDEIVVADWTRADAIKDGSEANVLEVRDANQTMNFYINGEFIRSVGNTDGYDGGVAGIYAGDAIKIAFSNFQISK